MAVFNAADKRQSGAGNALDVRQLRDDAIRRRETLIISLAPNLKTFGKQHII